MFSTTLFFSLLKTTKIGKTSKYFERISSTNAYLKQQKDQDIPHGSVIIADYQYQGTGHFGRSWYSSYGKNLMVSFKLNNDYLPYPYTWLPWVMALCIFHVIKSYTNEKCFIKWPNDIIVRNKKIAGVLIEKINDENKPFTIIGIGINIFENNFPIELQNKAITLHDISTKKDLNREMILALLCSQIETRLTSSPTIFKNWYRELNSYLKDIGYQIPLYIYKNKQKKRLFFAGMNQNYQLIFHDKQNIIFKYPVHGVKIYPYNETY